MRNLVRTYSILFLLLIMPSVATALSVETHKAINGVVGKVQTPIGFSLHQYLINNLGFDNGVDKGIDYPLYDPSTKTYLKINTWLELGGEYEDAPSENIIPYRRSRNHFHNPLKPWDQAYYTDWYAFCSAWNNPPFFISGHCPVSAILWAQGGYQPQATTDWFNPGGDWSWKQVREYYHIALSGRDISGTIVAPTQTDRSKYFANTFRGMGQLMHLVQDMSVPEHTRNDFHPYGGYEGWVEKNVDDKKLPGYGTTFFGGTINNISNLFDTDQYNGTNPSNSNGIGLSEYTNANFLSEGRLC